MGIVSTHLKGISCNNVCYFKRCECIIVKLLQSSNTVGLLRKMVKKISCENIFLKFPSHEFKQMFLLLICCSIFALLTRCNISNFADQYCFIWYIMQKLRLQKNKYVIHKQSLLLQDVKLIRDLMNRSICITPTVY